MAKRRKSKKRQQAIAELIWFAFLFATFGIYQLTKSIVQTEFLSGILFVLIIVFLIYRAYRRKQILRMSGIMEIDKMDGILFEHYLKELYSSYGYSAKVTQAVGDFGADLVLTKTGKKIVVQAKRYSGNVGVKAVQEIKAAQSHYNAEESWVVTNSYFTQAAVSLAKSNNVKLINRDQLIDQILGMKKTS